MSEKKKRSLLRKRIALLVMTGMLSQQLVFANPGVNDVVSSTGAAISGLGTNNVAVVVNAGRNSAIINWQNFSINSGQTMAFSSAAVGSSYAVLNRVVGNELSTIAGTISATQGGKVFLVNQNGIVFANGAIINAPMFVASTINITDTAFQKFADEGLMVFESANNLSTVNSGKSGAVMLAGNITSLGNIGVFGSAVTVAPGVTYTGTGDLLLLAADKASYNLDKGLAYTASAGNVVQIGPRSETEVASPVSLAANSVTLAGGAVNINGTATGQTVINATDDLRIYALNSRLLPGETTTDQPVNGQAIVGTTAAGNTITINKSSLLANNLTVVGHDAAVAANSLLRGTQAVTMYALDSIASLSPVSFTASGTYGDSITNSGTIVGGVVSLMAGGTIGNAAVGGITGTSQHHTSEVIAWGKLTNKGTITAPSYVVLSGKTVVDRSSDVRLYTISGGLVEVDTLSKIYSIASEVKTAVSAQLGYGGTKIVIDGQTQDPNPIPTGIATDQPVVKTNQITATAMVQNQAYGDPCNDNLDGSWPLNYIVKDAAPPAVNAGSADFIAYGVRLNTSDKAGQAGAPTTVQAAPTAGGSQGDDVDQNLQAMRALAAAAAASPNVGTPTALAQLSPQGNSQGNGTAYSGQQQLGLPQNGNSKTKEPGEATQGGTTLTAQQILINLL